MYQVWAGKTKTERDCISPERANDPRNRGLGRLRCATDGGSMRRAVALVRVWPDAMTRDLKTDGHAKGVDFYHRLNCPAVCGQAARWEFHAPFALAM